MRILVDMDGVIADWGAEYGLRLDTYGVEAASLPRHHDQLTFNLNAGRTKREQEIIAEILASPDFYSALQPIAGARTALRQAAKVGHDIRFVTSPWVSNPTCASDKLNWIVRHYGARWGQRVIITTDKTLVRGDILIDDKPEVMGAAHPEWEHILFDQPYNRAVTGKRRMTTWKDLEAIIHG